MPTLQLPNINMPINMPAMPNIPGGGVENKSMIKEKILLVDWVKVS